MTSMGHMPDPEQISEEVLRAAGHARPPTNLEAVCSLWSNLAVIEEDLDQAGYLVSLGVLGADIMVRRNDPPARKSFTIAHELGHWTLANMHAGRVQFDSKSRAHVPIRSQHKRNSREEIWCNKFAAGLLIPKSDLNKYLESPKRTALPHRILSGHLAFGVSQEAFLSRITEMTCISAFEVVCASSSARIRRKFISKFIDRDEVERLLTELLDESSKHTGILEVSRAQNSYQIQSKRIRQSSFSSLWMVFVVPNEAR